jgi:flavin-dependent dehydrogenase
MPNKYDVIIVGAGPAGLFATLELTKNGQKVLLIDKGRSIDAVSAL